MKANDELEKGLRLHRSGQLSEARACYEFVLKHEPNNHDALHLSGVALIAQGLVDAGISRIEQALAIAPKFVEAYNNLGHALITKGAFGEGASACEKALAIQPDCVAALTNLARAMKALRKFDRAEHGYRRVIALEPANAAAHNDLGIVLKARNQLEHAIASYRRALALKPDYAEAWNNLGAAFQAQNKLREALGCYERAVGINPRYDKAHFHQGIVQLLAGQLLAGWRKYEHRWMCELKDGRRDFLPPLWDGDAPLEGKSILLHAEQGLGDTLQFMRYAPLLAQRGVTVFLEVQAALKPLLSSLAGVKAVFAKGESLPAFDMHCPLLSLPLAFRTELQSIPCAVPYLQAAPDRVAEWRNEMAVVAGADLKVGIVWSGNPQHVNDHNRSVPFREFRHLSRVPSAHFFSLQKNAVPEDRVRLGALPNATDLGERLSDFSETAAIIANLDLVICVDTSVAHLAGALGKSTWLLLPYAPDWRWMLERQDSPWYPTMRLFRQPTTGDWGSVIQQVGLALRQVAGTSAALAV